MSEIKTRVDKQTIEHFLNGKNPKQYVVAIEGGYNEPSVNLVINDPNNGKYIEKHPYKPFLWFKDEFLNSVTGEYDKLYEGKKLKSIEAAERHGIKTKRLRISDENGYIPDRLANGYRYTATCSQSYNSLIQFFKEGGIDIFGAHSKSFFMFTPVEQFMIQTGIRLFKGMDDYNDLHRFQFDLETEGLTASKHSIFQIGMRDNRGFEQVLETVGNTPHEKRESERENILTFFKLIDILKPDVISGYNSESFDWDFIEKRCERLGINIDNIAKTLDPRIKFKRKPSILKLGNEVESYNQTYMYGYNVIDIAHSVRRAQAINSNIKSWGLKYVTKYSEIAKKNRVYIKGDKIYKTWADTTTQYAFNDINGDWYKITNRMGLKPDYKVVTGAYIVERYLLDDLWETEEVDNIFNQASFLISKLLPTSFSRSSTMGTATQWKLIMAAWSYENDLAIPLTERKREFTGGLSRLLKLGYAKNVVKLDYAALYPKTQLTNLIFPKLDISGVMNGLLTYVVDTRDENKFLTEKHKAIVKKLKAEIDANKGIYTKKKLAELESELKENKALQNLYDKKQLPLKILANSWFGAYGAPYIFNWGDTDCAEETTCRGRQYLRLMVSHFVEKYNFEALVGDTDGFNFSFPDNIDEIKYTAKGSHWKTEHYAGIELTGLEAVLAEFNENYMVGRMGLDIDDICESTINFSRKNYANLIGGKVKLVGNSIKSKKMPVYIEDFIEKAIRLLLDGKGKEFINYYYQYVDLIYNYNIPLVKIASKSKVKSTISDYRKKANKKNKAGNPMPKQAHMELAINAGLDVNLGDTIYYVNTGTAKSHGDLKTIKNANGSVEIQMNCKMIDSAIVESNLESIKEIESLNKMLESETDNDIILDLKNQIATFESELLTDEYNVAKYLESFNKKVKPLLVCFNADIRGKILLSIKKDKKTKLEKLSDKNIFTEEQCMLISGVADKVSDQDTYEELMTMEDKEIKFWDKVNMIPNNIIEEKWNLIREDYHIRKAKEREDGIAHDIKTLDDIFRRLELADLNKINETLTLPEEVGFIATIDDENNFISLKWGVVIGHILDVFKYEQEALERSSWYFMNNSSDYDEWLANRDANVSIENENNYKRELNAKLIVKEMPKVSEKMNEDDDEDDDEENEEITDDLEIDIQKKEFEIQNELLKDIKSDAIVLTEVSEKLKGRELFPEKNIKAKEYVSKVKFSDNLLNEIKSMPRIADDDNEWNF